MARSLRLLQPGQLLPQKRTHLLTGQFLRRRRQMDTIAADQITSRDRLHRLRQQRMQIVDRDLPFLHHVRRVQESSEPGARPGPDVSSGTALSSVNSFSAVRNPVRSFAAANQTESLFADAVQESVGPQQDPVARHCRTGIEQASVSQVIGGKQLKFRAGREHKHPPGAVQVIQPTVGQQR